MNFDYIGGAMIDDSRELNNLPVERQRKPYTKPQVETVPLMPKQTVLGESCYSLSISGAVSLGCRLTPTASCVGSSG
jgi:hypothetical protein